MGLYGKPVDSTENWEPVMGPDGKALVYTMDAFFAANDTMSQTVTVNSYNSEGQEMEYRFFEISVNGVQILDDEDLAANAELEDKPFTIELDNGQVLSFVSQRVDDEEIEETGEQVIENVIQDEITYPFQVNGKVRERFSISRNAGKEEIETLVRERFASYFEGKTVVKFIVVPGRIVNVVVK